MSPGNSRFSDAQVARVTLLLDEAVTRRPPRPRCLAECARRDGIRAAD